MYLNQQVILRENLKVATIVKIISESNKYLVSYYDEKNIFKHSLISKDDTIDSSEYEIIKNRINTINKLLD